MMAPMMTLYVSIYHMGLCPELLGHWLMKLVQNFPFALCAQMFYVGPLVRLIFRTIFKKQLTGATDLPHDLQKTAQSYSLIAPRRPSPRRYFL